MHTDEAVHAIKFGSLLEENYYRYDPIEYHGPTLNYLTLIPAWLSSAHKLTQVNETTLRIVPVFFGMLLILGLLLLVDGLRGPAVLLAALVTTISPAMVYYSRYYIQEMLLVSFTFGAIVSGYRYFKNQRIIWAISAGLFLGLMHATKETCIIAFASMMIALLLTMFFQTPKKEPFFNRLPKMKIGHISTVVVTALIVSVLFYSSFSTNPKGILDSVFTYKTYLNRAGQNLWHIHPWYYYFKLIIFSKQSGTPVWTEMIIVLLSIIGFIFSMSRKQVLKSDKNLSRFIAFYTLVMIIAYSAIPYKTPWSMLGFYHGMILLAGIGAAYLLESISNRLLLSIYVLIIAVSSGHLIFQTILSNYKYEADPSNPYVYAHTGKDVFIITKKIKDIAQAHPDGENMFVEVICPKGDYWPLPWYLRSFPNVGWWNEVDYSQRAAAVIIASPSVEDDVLIKLYELPPPGEKNLYLPLFDRYIELRPQIEIRGYVEKDLWDSFVLQNVTK